MATGHSGDHYRTRCPGTTRHVTHDAQHSQHSGDAGVTYARITMSVESNGHSVESSRLDSLESFEYCQQLHDCGHSYYRRSLRHCRQWPFRFVILLPDEASRMLAPGMPYQPIDDRGVGRPQGELVISASGAELGYRGDGPGRPGSRMRS
jgi:hypothetical protein